METKVLVFNKHGIVIIIFNRCKELTAINKEDIKR